MMIENDIGLTLYVLAVALLAVAVLACLVGLVPYGVATWLG